jgi:hypothetical protein
MVFIFALLDIVKYVQSPPCTSCDYIKLCTYQCKSCGGGRPGLERGFDKNMRKLIKYQEGGGGENSSQIKVTFPTHRRRATYFKLFKNTNLLTNIERRENHF